MFKSIKKERVLCFVFSALILTVGCSKQQTQSVSADTFEEESLVQKTVEEPTVEGDTQKPTLQNPEIDKDDTQDVSVSTEPVSEQREPSQEDAQAVNKLEFAVRYMDSARKGILSYSQAVVLCRDIIKQYPDTPYEKQARELLSQIPEDQRSRYHITDEELGF